MAIQLEPVIAKEHFEYQITCIDSHTQGEALRLAVNGIPHLSGKDMIEKRKYFQDHYDFIRTALMDEPRGHRDMFGAILTEPVHEEADYGIFFLTPDGYIDMCGHGTIAAATDLVETGLVKKVEPYTDLRFDTGAGIVTAKVKIVNGRAAEVRLNNVPAFVFKENLTTVVDGKEYQYDLAFGGDFFTMVDARQVGLEINVSNYSTYADLGVKMLEAVNREVEIKHPTADIEGSIVCEFYDSTKTDHSDMKNIVIFGDYQADRSPCGTGTSAKMAVLHKRGEFEIGESLINESFIGSIFKGELVGETKVGEFEAVLPVITGTANVVGVATFLIDPEDRLKYGFHIGK